MSYKTPDYGRYRDLQSRTTSLVRDYLLEEIYPNTAPEELAREWNIHLEMASRLCTAKDLSLAELMFLLDLSQVNFGMLIRDPASDREVSFLPLDNLHEDEEEEQIYISEETVSYGPDEESDKEIERCGIPDSIPRVTSIIDGSYTLEDEDPRNPFLLEKEDQVVDAEFSEITERDLQEMVDSQCENCLENERVDDSRLCHFCLQAGVVADPLELVARVNIRAAETKERSLRLIEQANMVLQSKTAAEGEEEEEENESPEEPRRGNEEEEEPSWVDAAEDKYDPEVRRKYFDFGDDEEEE